jgi:hypothetical protein
VVPVWVVTVAVAVPGTDTDAGLTVHTGVSVVCCGDVTWQLRFTVPLNPLTGPTVIRDDETPPGATASGLNDAAVRVNSDVPCAAATVASTEARVNARSTQTHAATPRLFANFTLDSNHSDLNMNGFWFK